MKLFLTILLALFMSASLEASYFLLGSNSQKLSKITTKDTIVVQAKSDTNYTFSQPLQDVDITKLKGSGYILVNDNSISYKTTPYMKKTYTLKKGWNYLFSAKNGVDIEKTFSHEGVDFVYVYDKKTQAWAGYSSEPKLMEKLRSTRILTLKYIEPELGFYVYAKKSMSLPIYTNTINGACKKLIEKDNLLVLIDSGLKKGTTYDKKNGVGIESRYNAHYRRGFYTDTRVALLYTKLAPKTKKFLKYGPAIPKAMLYYTKEREDSYFFMYDFFQKECYMGVVPSLKVPPLSSLKKIK